MANYKGHLYGGIAAGLIVDGAYFMLQDGTIDTGVALRESWQLFVGLIIIAALFGLWPDIDTNSKAQNIFFSIALITDLMLIATGYFEAAAFLGLMAMTPIVGRHRGWTHSKLAAVLVPLPILIIPYLSTAQFQETGILLYVAALMGYLSHLLLDGLIWRRIRVKSKERW